MIEDAKAIDEILRELKNKNEYLIDESDMSDSEYPKHKFYAGYLKDKRKIIKQKSLSNYKKKC